MSASDRDKGDSDMSPPAPLVTLKHTHAVKWPRFKYDPKSCVVVLIRC
jgi:hypothetical protein